MALTSELPRDVVETIFQIWQHDDPAKMQHAAKQAFCYFLEETKLSETDDDVVVNYGLKIGMIAQRCIGNSAHRFIREFNRNILKDWCDRS